MTGTLARPVAPQPVIAQLQVIRMAADTPEFMLVFLDFDPLLTDLANLLIRRNAPARDS
jgi:hypothetical protein